MEWITHAEVLDADREGKGQRCEANHPSTEPIVVILLNHTCCSLVAGLLPLTSGDSDTDSLYDLEGKSRVIYY